MYQLRHLAHLLVGRRTAVAFLIYPAQEVKRSKLEVALDQGLDGSI
jgi:hypothetical protein